MSANILDNSFMEELVGWRSPRPPRLTSPYITSEPKPSPFCKVTGDKLAHFLSLKGQFARIDYVRTIKGEGRYRGTSLVVGVEGRAVQAGADYSNRKATIAARARGDAPATPQPLPWGQWISFPYVIGHKGQNYLRFYRYRGSDSPKPSISYFYQGREITLEAARRIAPKATRIKKANDWAPITIKEAQLMDIR